MKQETARRATSAEKIRYWPGAERDPIFMTRLLFQVALAAAHAAAPQALSILTILNMIWSSLVVSDQPTQPVNL